MLNGELGQPMLEEDLRINFDELEDQVDFEAHMQSSNMVFSSQEQHKSASDLE